MAAAKSYLQQHSRTADGRIFLAVAIGSALSFALLCLATYYIQQRNLDRALLAHSARFEKGLQREIDHEAKRMRLLSGPYLLESASIKTALRQRDRQRLLRLSRGIFAKLKENFGITHLYFHDPDRVNILRVHQPDRFGDTIGRQTMLAAAKRGSSSAGYELGPLGTLTLRVVTPWYDGVGLIGYVEMGKEMELLAHNVAEHEDMQVWMAVNKRLLNQQGYAMTRRKKGLPVLWDEFERVVMINRKARTPAAIRAAMAAWGEEQSQQVQMIASGDRYYSLAALPMIDAGGQRVGNFFMVVDVSDEMVASHRVLLVIILIGLLVTGLFLLFFHSRLRHARKERDVLLQAIFATGEAMMIVDRAGVVQYVNPAFSRLTGYSAEELVGHNLPVCEDEDSFCHAMWESIHHGEMWEGKIRVRRKDEIEYPAKLTISPIYQQQGDQAVITHFVSVQSDLGEIERLEQQFYQAQKMEAIGTLVGGIAHDFNNMLAGISGNLHLAEQAMAQPDELRARLANINTLTFRAGKMIQQLLTFARKGRVSVKPIALRTFLHETLNLLRASLPENIRLEEAIDDATVMINGDETQLHQVLMNLLGNARDAVAGVAEPVILVRMAMAADDDARLQQWAGKAHGPYVHIAVGDNGCGMPPEVRDHLFEPFFTTKEQGKGTGLGLAMVFGAIKTHQGFIDVESAPGAGATFHIYLPVAGELGDVAGIDVDLVQGGGEVVLLADDEAYILETGRSVLESLGYQVVTASDGDQAVQVYQLLADKIDLCVFDVVMPVMGGDAAAKAIRQRWPDAKIIFATGYDQDLLHDLDDEIVISKPFAIEEFSRLIQQVLQA